MPPDLRQYRRHWAARRGPAPFLPTGRAEMNKLGWDACDIVIVSGDAYIDHPSFGMAIIGRVLEAQGFRVGNLAQPVPRARPAGSRGDRLRAARARPTRTCRRDRRHRGEPAAHRNYDYWQEKVRRSILLDAKADLLVYGNAERIEIDSPRIDEPGAVPARPRLVDTPHRGPGNAGEDSVWPPSRSAG